MTLERSGYGKVEDPLSIQRTRIVPRPPAIAQSRILSLLSSKYPPETARRVQHIAARRTRQRGIGGQH